MNRIHDIITRSADAYPASVAILDHDGRSVSYADLDSLVAATAALLGERGVRPGDRVLILGENCLEMVTLLYAASRIGAWAIPSNARMAAGEIDRIIAHAEPRIIAVTEAVSSAAANHGRRLGAVGTTLGPTAFALTPAVDCAPEPSRGETADEVAVLMYTTGTTGAPKGVMLSHANLLFGGNASATVRELRNGDRVYAVLPFSHIFGLASALTASLLVGATLQLEPRFVPEKLYDALKGGATVLPAVPQMHALLMQHVREKGLDKLDAPQLRYVSSGAAPLDPDWKRRAEAFYGVALQNGYGMTESTAGISTTKLPIGDPDISAGKALAGTEIRIAPPPGQDSLKDGVGEVLARGPHIMLGYYKNPEETAKALEPDGFLHTGDLGVIDENGNLSIVGRCKELIIRGGFNIYPPEVEAALNDHPAVIQTAVIGRKLTDGNEEVLAFVQVPSPDATTEAELKAHLKDRLTPYKHPARIILTDALPAASTGKILKHQLVATFRDQLG